MQTFRDSKKVYLLCLFLVLFMGAYSCLSLFTNDSVTGRTPVSYAVMIAVILIWITHNRRRFLQEAVLRLLSGAAVLMCVWIFVRSVRYELISQSIALTRYLWYFYYIPIIIIPLLFYLVTRYAGQRKDERIAPRYYYMFIPAAVLCLLIMTNDYHFLAFRFDDPEAIRSGVVHLSSYTHGPLYYAVWVWIAFLMVSSTRYCLRQSMIRPARHTVLLLLLPFVLGIFYCVNDIFFNYQFLSAAYRLPDFVCLLLMLYAEILVNTGLIPCNSRYEDFWTASSLGAGIMDEKGKFCFLGREAVPVTKEEVQMALAKPVLLQDGNQSLQSHPISGGICYWIKDNSEIRGMNAELSELGDVLAEENTMLEAENVLLEEEEKARQQNLLYDNISRRLSPQLSRLQELLSHLPEEETAFQEQMRCACILNAYVKRFSNLLLLAAQDSAVDCEELRLAMKESMDYVRLCGVLVYAEWTGSGKVRSEAVLGIYEYLERILERSIPGATAVLLSLGLAEEKIQLRVEVGGETQDPEKWFADLNESYGVFPLVSADPEGRSRTITVGLPLAAPKRMKHAASETP